MFEIFIALIPVTGGILNSWITSLRGGRKDESDIIVQLALELKKEKTISFVLESYIPILFRCRPIPSGVLKKLLYLENSFEILQLISPCRKLLVMFDFTEHDDRIKLQYRVPFMNARNRVTCIIVCILMMSLCIYTASEKLAFILITLSQENDIGPILNSLYFIGSMLGSYIFAWQLYILSSASNRFRKANALLAKNYTDS